VYIFGSTTRCTRSIYGCSTAQEKSDLDILIVYPQQEIERALAIRRYISAALDKLNIPSDIVLLDEAESSESQFAQREKAIELSTITKPCLVTPAQPYVNKPKPLDIRRDTTG
jgi:predicted nucleotidyltransferase